MKRVNGVSEKNAVNQERLEFFSLFIKAAFLYLPTWNRETSYLTNILTDCILIHVPVNCEPKKMGAVHHSQKFTPSYKIVRISR